MGNGKGFGTHWLVGHFFKAGALVPRCVTGLGKAPTLRALDWTQERIPLLGGLKGVSRWPKAGGLKGRLGF